MSAFCFFFNRAKYRENGRMLIAHCGQKDFRQQTKSIFKKSGGWCVPESTNFTNLPRTYSLRL